MIALDLLTRPIVDLLDSFGCGIHPFGGPVEALRASSAALDAVYDTGRIAISGIHDDWQGKGGTGAITKTEEAQRVMISLSDRGNDMAAIVAEASEIVRVGALQVTEILQSFLSLAVAAGPTLTTPPGQAMLLAAALDHLSRATAVVETVRAQLDEKTAAMVALTPAEHAPTAPVPTEQLPAGGQENPDRAHTAPAFSAPAFSAPAFSAPSFSAPSFSAPSFSAPSFSAPAFSGADPVPQAHALPDGGGVSGEGAPARESTPVGRGVEVVLPDGSTALAPNNEAAAAVRNALSQQGVPYVWGGTSPGEGLDCSGLTQWAYAEAGVGLPRLAQEQAVGTAVDPGELMPGDLAVWEGHVAMVIGNNQIVEAGDPVQVGPIRTSNSDMSFYGFYRPTG